MLLALVTVPLVLPAQLLWSIELTEAIADRHLVDKELRLVHHWLLELLIV